MQNIHSYRPVFNSNDTLIHYGVKGMKWDESKKKGTSEYERLKNNYNSLAAETDKGMKELGQAYANASKEFQVANAQYKKQEEAIQRKKDNTYNSIVKTAGQIQNYIKKIADNPISKFINKNIVPKSKILKGIQEAANKLNASYRNGDLRKALRIKGVDV